MPIVMELQMKRSTILHGHVATSHSGPVRANHRGQQLTVRTIALINGLPWRLAKAWVPNCPNPRARPAKIERREIKPSSRDSGRGWSTSTDIPGVALLSATVVRVIIISMAHAHPKGSTRQDPMACLSGIETRQGILSQTIKAPPLLTSRAVQRQPLSLPPKMNIWKLHWISHQHAPHLRVCFHFRSRDCSGLSKRRA